MKRAITLALFATILVPLCAWAQKTPGAIQPNWTPPTAAGVGWESGTYKYDGSGNIAAIGQDLFGYDGANRLTGSTVAAHGVATSQTFRYDRNGNLLGVDTSVMPAGLQQPLRTFNAAMTVDSQANRALHTCENLDVSLPPQCQTWSYDEAGKQTGLGTAVKYRWDAVGSMSELTADPVHEQYVYDANDERVVMVTLGRTSAEAEQEVTRRWTWRDAENKVAREAVEHVGTAVWSDARDYVYREGMLLASFESPNASIAERHYHVDHLGTPRLITNAQRGALAIEGYLPFGGRAPGRETARIDYSERMQFTGHERDGDDSPYRPALDYMHARYYTPQWGRFLSVDPAFDSDKTIPQPQKWNRYAYVVNNPINRIDLDGKDEYLLTWVPVGDSVGHSAIAIQNRDKKGNPNGTVTVRDLWPDGTAGKNNLSLRAVYGQQIIPESDIKTYVNRMGRAADGIVKIAGDARQDVAVRAGLSANAEAHPNYTVPTQVCSNFTAAGTTNIGLPPTQTGTVTVWGGPWNVINLAGATMVTPVALHNSLATSGDPRVSVMRQPANLSPNIDIYR